MKYNLECSLYTYILYKKVLSSYCMNVAEYVVTTIVKCCISFYVKHIAFKVRNR